MPNDLKFVIVGQLQDPAYERKLKALIIQLRLEHRVIFTGVIRGVDKYYLYRNAVAMVHMALWESGCNVVREGMSQGLPCIVSNVYGLPGLVKDGLNGFCLPVRDSKRVAEKVLWILDPQNTEYVQKMREVNISFGMGQSWKDVAQKMDTLYKSYTPRNMGSVSFSIFLLLRNSLYSMTALLDRFFPNHTPRIVIYCYHSISDDGLRFSVTAENFKKQMELLLKNQVPLSVRDLPMYLRGEKKLVRDAFIITFDDGYADIITMKDFLESKNISPTAFVLSCPEEANYAELETKKEFLSVMQLKDLKESGWEIGSHSGTHTDFLHLSADQMDREIEKSKKELEERLGSSIKYFAYPKGVYTQEILETVSKAGYSLAFSMDDGYANSQHHHFVLPRVGVDGTHSLQQFSHLASPLAMKSRKFIKKVLRLV
jgi:peptidoglycan/xylan/chitin deacetylase (PgdA/CDA1 family)